MRKALLTLTLLASALFPTAAHADAGLVLSAPVPGALLRPFDGGTSPYSAGHRGVDLAADQGEEVRSAAVGKIYFNGEVAGRPSVSVDHGNGLRTTYTPVAGSLPEGTQVRAGEVIGHLAGPPHCDPRYCLHWGLTDGTIYHDPMLYLKSPPIRLLPHGTTPPPVTWLPPAQVPGPTPEPGSLPVAGPITSPFGMRVHPVTGVLKLHDGADIGAACGTAIHLPWAGTVISAGYDGGYGYRVVVEHSGIRTGYAHMPGIEVTAGRSLEAGAVVGHVGSTGYSTGCHLHWMAWRNGQVIDPLTLVR